MPLQIGCLRGNYSAQIGCPIDDFGCPGQPDNRATANFEPWAEASRDILKFRVSEMPVPGAFKRYFSPWTPCCFVRIYARLATSAVKIS